MGDKKYQIFVSSTFEDLQEERKGVIESILRLRQLPAGMELFSASSDEQFKYIKRVIDDSDYYVLIIKNRYGSTNKKTKKSYTEMEFDYALEKGLPILVFIHKESENKIYASKNYDFINFLDKTKTNRIVRYWSNAYDLKTEVHMGLSEEFVEKPQQGWQRFEDKTALLEELNTLKKENSELESKLSTKTSKFENIVNLDDEITVKCLVQKTSYMVDNLISVKTTLSEIIRDTGYGILKPTIESTFKKSLITSFQKQVHEYRQILGINQDSYEEVILTLKAYNIITKAYQKGFEIIQLTPVGEEYLMSNKIIKNSFKKEKV